MFRNWTRIVPVLLMGLLIGGRPAEAGPPLLCHPFDIAGAASLPWDGGKSWWAGGADYDLQKLVRDTEALLTPSTPVIVRMETLRRAAIYGSRDGRIAAQLLAALTDRVRRAEQAGVPDAFALFDAGYLGETFKEIALLAEEREFRAAAAAVQPLAASADGYVLLQRSLALRPADPAMQFAAALIAKRGNPGAYQQHAERARRGAGQDALLARNVKQLT